MPREAEKGGNRTSVARFEFFAVLFHHTVRFFRKPLSFLDTLTKGRLRVLDLVEDFIPFDRHLQKPQVKRRLQPLGRQPIQRCWVPGGMGCFAKKDPRAGVAPPREATTGFECCNGRKLPVR